MNDFYPGLFVLLLIGFGGILFVIFSSEEFNSCINAFVLGRKAREAWRAALHRISLYEPKGSSPFSTSLLSNVPLAQFCWYVIEPLKETHPEISQQFFFHCKELGWPKDYDGVEPERYFYHTELYDHVNRQVPFHFYDKTRFQHMHVLGDWGSTKTTFLSHLIMEDVKRIPNVSVVVLDSQFRLIDGLAKLPNIKPILIGPSHPIGLNLFHLGNPDATADILSYAFGEVFGAEATALQSGPMRYVIKAVCKHPKPNLDVVQDFLRNPKQYQLLINQCDKRTKDYFANDFNLGKTTRAGITSRIAIFREHAVLDQMLNAPTLDIDLPKVLAEGSLVLFDTNKDDFGSERSRVFGRMAIALVNNVMQRRIKIDEEKLKSTFFYIDEAHDVVHDDPKFVEMMEQARKQRIAICAAHHHDGQLSPIVKQSLDRAAFQVRCLGKGKASVSILKDRPKIVSYEKFEFSEQITPNEYAERYLVKPTKDLAELGDLPDVV